ncbi:MAG: hypothetical protein PVH04_11520, partial [Gammaproteobacteria bacterium]
MSRCRYRTITAILLVLVFTSLTGCDSGPDQQKTQSTATQTPSSAGDKTPAAATESQPAMAASDGKTANPRVHEFKLDNGLKVLVKEDHRAP